MLNQPFEKSPALTGEHNTDVIIIGGGYAGLSSALGLLEAQPDLSITIIDAEHLGFGASGRTAGHFFNMPPHGLMLQDLSKHKNLSDVHFARQIVDDQVNKLFALLENANLDCEVIEDDRVGAVARTSFAMAGLRWAEKLLNTVGVKSDLYEGEAVKARIAYRAKGYLSMPTIPFHPYKMIQALRTLLERQGVNFFERTPATSIQNTTQGVRVNTPKGVVQAQKAVVTTNAYIRQNELKLEPRFPKTSVLHTYMIATDQLSEEQMKAISPSVEDFGDAAITFFYSRFHDKRFLFGGVDRKSEASVDDDRREKSFRKLHAELISRFPFLSEIPLYAAWGGAFQNAGSNVPLIKRAAENSNIIYNTGYSDGGIAGTLFSSRLMPTLVLEKNNDPDALRYLSLLEKSRIPLRGILRAGTGVLGALLRNLL
jgi:glycine/D-amino acid oxidase-like deaminating enzyme